MSLLTKFPHTGKNDYLAGSNPILFEQTFKLLCDVTHAISVLNNTNIILIIDSCFSGYATRGHDLGRSVEIIAGCGIYIIVIIIIIILYYIMELIVFAYYITLLTQVELAS